MAIKSLNHLAIVPEQDMVGRGTHMACIAAGGGKTDKYIIFYSGPRPLNINGEACSFSTVRMRR